MSILIWIIDQSGTIRWTSRSHILAGLGYAWEELLDRHIAELHPAHAQENVKQTVSEVLAGRAKRFQLSLVSKDGTQLLEVAWSSIGTWRDHHLIFGVVESPLKITPAKTVEESLPQSEDLLELFFSQSLDGFFFMMLDEPIHWDAAADKEKLLDYVFSHHRVSKVNDAMLAQYNIRREDFIGRTPNDLFAHDPQQGRRVWRQFFDTGHLHIDTDERKADGTPMWVEGDYICLYDAQGRIIGHFGIQRDITARRQLEQSVQGSEARFRALFEQANDAVFLLDVNGKHIAVNQRATEMLGYSTEELMSLSVYETSADVEKSLSILKRLLNGESIPPYERIFRRKDGSHIPVEVNIEAVFDSQGTFSHFQSIWRDTTEHKQAEAKLRESTTRLLSLFEGARDAIIIADPETGIILDVNSELESIMGLPRDKIIGQHYLSLHPEDQAEENQTYFNRSTHETIGLIELELLNCAGGRVPVEVNASMVHLPNGKQVLQGFFRNITERKLAEKKLLDSETRWKFALEGAGDGLWDYNIETGEIFFSSQWKGMLGYAEQDIGNTLDEWKKRVHPDDMPHVIIEMNNLLNGDTTIYTSEHRVRCKDGTYKWVLSRGKVTQAGENHMPLRVIGTHTDITVRKNNEEQIRTHIQEIETLHNELREQAIRDPLTGLHNHRHLPDMFSREFSRAARGNFELCVIMIDMDGLKTFNDTHGHHAGDMAIQLFAAQLRKMVRLEDVICRYGGDEFIILMNDTHLNQALKRVEEWRTSIKQIPMEISPNQTYTITFTAGIASYPAHGDNTYDVISHADIALYRGKSKGRNCTIIFE